MTDLINRGGTMIERTHRRRRGTLRLRAAAVVVAVLAAAGVSVGLASPAAALGRCDQMPSGWQPIESEIIQGVSVQAWKYPGGWKLARTANLLANGKSNVYAAGGTYINGENLGYTGDIGPAPYGAWCSLPTQGPQIFSVASFDAPSDSGSGIRHFWRALSCGDFTCLIGGTGLPPAW